MASLLDISALKNAEEAIHESEQKYRSLAATVDSMYLVDSDTRYLFMNDNYLGRFGMALSEILGKKYSDFHSAGSSKKFKNVIKQVCSTGKPFQYEHHSERDGRTFLRTYTPVHNSSGTIAVTVVAKDITERKKVEETLKMREKELKIKTHNLEEMNTALKVLLRQRENDRSVLEERVLINVKQLILPYVEKLKKLKVKKEEMVYVDLVETNLSNITSQFSQKLSSQYMHLTPREIQIANLIKEGKTTKEIMNMLNVSLGAVNIHRNNIRKKLSLKNKKINMRSHLLSLT